MELGDDQQNRSTSMCGGAPVSKASGAKALDAGCDRIIYVISCVGVFDTERLFRIANDVCKSLGRLMLSIAASQATHIVRVANPMPGKEV